MSKDPENRIYPAEIVLLGVIVWLVFVLLPMTLAGVAR